ncbi:MAG: carboxymuconolactone decarboxylase family protein [Pseudaminobacter sp.]|nr:carboxymuconolactone decarboxylase family protein [Pseudaminobacter sp.]
MTSVYKMTLPARTMEDADEKVSAVLEKAKARVGAVPNMYGVMANSPGLLETYLDGYARFRQDSGFTPIEQEVVLLTISRNNGCDYCMAAHSTIADKASGVPSKVTDAIRGGHDIPDPKLAALSVFVDRMLSSRGMPTPDDVSAFLEVGYSERQILELVLAIAVKTLSNYSNHLFHTPLDARFADREWKKQA